jgi:hypothetical protein
VRGASGDVRHTRRQTRPVRGRSPPADIAREAPLSVPEHPHQLRAHAQAPADRDS